MATIYSIQPDPVRVWNWRGQAWLTCNSFKALSVYSEWKLVGTTACSCFGLIWPQQHMPHPHTLIWEFCAHSTCGFEAPILAPKWGFVTASWVVFHPQSSPYSTYYKPMGDLPYISSGQGGLIIRTELIYESTTYKRPIPIQELWAEGGRLIIHHGLIIRTIWYLLYILC